MAFDPETVEYYTENLDLPVAKAGAYNWHEVISAVFDDIDSLLGFSAQLNADETVTGSWYFDNYKLRFGQLAPNKPWYDGGASSVFEIGQSGFVSADSALYLMNNLYVDEATLSAAYTKTGAGSYIQLAGGALNYYVATSGAEDATANLALALKVFNDGGLVVGAAGGSSKGLGTVNAVAVYDDNTLLTDYVFDLYIDGAIKEEDLKQGKSLLDQKEILNLDKYIERWSNEKSLPSMPSREEFKKNGLSVGELAQRLWETVELQAIHISLLNERIKKLEAKQ